MSNSETPDNILSEKLGSKLVTRLPGIDPACGDLLSKEKYYTAYMVLGKYLTLEKNRVEFQRWLRSYGIGETNSIDCSAALESWTQQFMDNNIESNTTVNSTNVSNSQITDIDRFISERIDDKDVGLIPGINPNLAFILRNKGYNKAYKILGEYLILQNNKKAFKSWLTDLLIGDIEQMVNALESNSQKFILFRDDTESDLENQQNEQGKYLKFMSENLHHKLVTCLPGIGEISGDKLAKKKYYTAYMVLGEYLLRKQDRQNFKQWLKSIYIKSPEAGPCSKALYDWTRKFLNCPMPGQGETPTVTTNSTSNYFDRFVSEPIGDKDVTAIPGISDDLVNILRGKGYNKAYMILGKYLILQNNKQAFKSWLKGLLGADFEKIGKALESYSQTNIL